MPICTALTLYHMFPQCILGYKKYYWTKKKIHIKWEHIGVFAVSITIQETVTEENIWNSLPAAKYKIIYQDLQVIVLIINTLHIIRKFTDISRIFTSKKLPSSLSKWITCIRDGYFHSEWPIGQKIEAVSHGLHHRQRITYYKHVLQTQWILRIKEFINK